MIQTDENGTDASLFILHAAYPLKSNVYIQAEQPYITVSTKRGIKNGFGDFRLSARAYLFSRSRASISFLSILRSGSGSRDVFPYASGSIDVEMGAAVVDTLSAFTLWGAVTTTVVWLAPKRYDQAAAHGNHTTITLGVLFPIRTRVDLEFIGSGYLFNSGATREIYSIQASYQPSSFVKFFGSVHMEGGKDDERVSDFAAAAGARIFY